MIPKLSVVVTSFNAPLLLEKCLAALVPQARNAGAEIVVVGDWNEEQDRRESFESCYPDIIWICAPRRSTVPQLRGLGLAHSRGEIVAMLEDDCVPADRWCAAVAHAHREPHIAIGGAVEPGHYRRGLDWAVYFCEYGRFMLPLPEGEPLALPINNVSYKRQALATFLSGSRTDTAAFGFDGLYDVFLQQRLRKAGHSLKADPAVVVHNVNTWRLAHAISVPFHHGRGYAAMRIAGSSPWRRLPFLAMTALLPLVQVGRITAGALTRRRDLGRLGQALPWVVLYAICWSLGEFAGYLRGPGDSLRRWR